MRLLKSFVIVSLFVLISLNCLGTRPCLKEQRKKDRRMQAERDFDPWTIEKENPIIIQEESAEVQEEFVTDIWEKDEPGETNKNYEILYQIQIFASKFPEEAQNLADSLETNFAEPASIDYEAPYYKVRLGNFETLKEAEIFLKRIRQKGFPQAWVVMIKKEEREEDDPD